MTNFGKPVSLRSELAPGRILYRPSGDGERGFIGFTSALSDPRGRHLGVFVGDELRNGVIFTQAIGGIAWDVTDIVEVVPEFSASTIVTSGMRHGTMFLGAGGELCVYGVAPEARYDDLSVEVSSGEMLEVPHETVAFSKWKLVSKDQFGKERGIFDPADFTV